jgi:hypothetical protein
VYLEIIDLVRSGEYQKNLFSNITNALFGNNIIILGIMCVVIIALVVDTSLNKISDLYTGQSVLGWRISVFIVITVIYTTGQYFLLQFVGHKIHKFRSRQMLHLTLTYRIVVVVQSVLIGSMLVAILEMFLKSSYDVAILISTVAISYGTATVMMALLALKLFSWFRSNFNSVVLTYALSAAGLAINALLTAVLVILLLASLQQEVESTHIYSLPASFLPGSPTDLANSAYFISSITSFILTWIAAAMILHHYSNRLGRIKYWTVVSLPLVYFLTQFVSFSTGLFAPLLASDPTFYGILLSVMFIISKAIGGILFGLAFWTIRRTVGGSSVVKDYVTLSAIGFALLFVSNQGIVLTNAFYPPFGLATASFMGLASYLILIGIYSSAISVSEDSTLRRTIRSFVRKSRLLDSIGTAQMEHEIQKRVVALTKQNQARMEEESGVQSSLSEEEVKAYLEQVLREVKKPNLTNEDNGE